MPVQETQAVVQESGIGRDKGGLDAAIHHYTITKTVHQVSSPGKRQSQQRRVWPDSSAAVVQAVDLSKDY